MIRRRIHRYAGAFHPKHGSAQAFPGQTRLDRLEDPACQSVCFQQTAKLQQRRRIRNRFPSQIDGADRLTVVGRILSHPETLEPSHHIEFQN